MKTDEKQLWHYDQRNLRWIMKRCHYQGLDRLSLWPHFHKDGEWLPCAARFGGGVNLPADAVPGLIAALQEGFGLTGGDA